MSSFSLRLASSACLFAILLGGCSSANSDNLAQMNAKAKAAAAQQQKPIVPERPKSRLDAQPMAPTMGQPLSDAQVAALNPAPTPAPQATPSPQMQMTQADLGAMKSNKIGVALLVPLSGKNAPLGQAMLNAAQLAVFDMAPKDFELMPRDTAGNPETAATAARDALQSGARLVIGPLFAPDVAAVKPAIQTSSANMLALTTDVSLAEPGTYVMGFAPAPQVSRVVSFAASQGARSFAAVIPPGAYGTLVRKAFEDAVKQADGKIIIEETPAKLDAVLAKKDEIDALFLPLAGSELKLAAARMTAAGVDRAKMRLLGTGLWDEPGLGQTQFLVGGLYAASDPAARAAFVSNYQKSYGQEPPRLASLAYDATALAAVLAANGGSFDRAALGNPNGFAGIDGIFRFTSGGQAERGLAVNEITPTGNHVIDPAPTTFAKAQ